MYMKNEKVLFLFTVSPPPPPASSSFARFSSKGVYFSLVGKFHCFRAAQFLVLINRNIIFLPQRTDKVLIAALHFIMENNCFYAIALDFPT